MPKPGSFDKGKYGKFNPEYQTGISSSYAEFGTIEDGDKKLYDRIQKYVISSNEKKFDSKGQKSIGGKTFNEYFPASKTLN